MHDCYSGDYLKNSMILVFISTAAGLHIHLSCSAYNAVRSLNFIAATLKELFENTNSLHILDFIKDFGIYKQI